MNENKKNYKNLIIIFLIFLIICIGIFIYFKLTKNNKNENTINNTAESNNYTNSSTNNEIDTNTTDNKESSFLMYINDVFNMTGRGIAVTGEIKRGTIKVNDEVEIIGLNEEKKLVKVKEIILKRKLVNTATVGDDAGIILENIKLDEVKRGQVLATENTVKASTKFAAKIEMSKEEKNSIQNGDTVKFDFKTINVEGKIKILDNKEIANISVEIFIPIVVEVGTEFSIKEDTLNKTIALGTVTQLYDE